VSFNPGGAITEGRVAILQTEVTLLCRATASGSLEARLVAISGEGATIGRLTAFTGGLCEAATWTLLGTRPEEGELTLNLPWAIRLRKLNEVNPSSVSATGITSARIDVSGESLELYNFMTGTRCLYGRPEVSLDVQLSLSRIGRTTEYRVASGRIIGELPRTSGGCASTLRGGLEMLESPRQTWTFLS
jgi:hypothetical protein